IGDETFQKEASFVKGEITWFDRYTVFESSTKSGHYLVHERTALRMAKYIDNVRFQENASFAVTRDCRRTVIGKKYDGKTNRDMYGKPCQRWDTKTPNDHEDFNPDDFPEGNITAAGNKCRNPTNM
ncbi:unnamed protein product, partial [Owenia fusiformis]